MTAPPDTVTLPDVAFLGRAGAGKTTAAEILRDHYGYTIISFAKELKDIAARIWGPAARKDRDKLQRLGVAVREIDEDAWARLLIELRDRLAQTPHDSGRARRFVVDDLRFPNEYRMLGAAGFTFVRVHADRGERIARLKGNGKLQDEAQLEHISETALDGYFATPLFNDTTTVALGEVVARLLTRKARELS